MNWRHKAACKDEDAELFFPVGESGPAKAQADRAKAVCGPCPVRAECLNGAVDEGDDWSIRGGTTAKERRNLTHTRR